MFFVVCNFLTYFVILIIVRAVQYHLREKTLNKKEGGRRCKQRERNRQKDTGNQRQIQKE